MQGVDARGSINTALLGIDMYTKCCSWAPPKVYVYTLCLPDVTAMIDMTTLHVCLVCKNQETEGSKAL